MKACPYCAAQIQDAAIKCRFCSMFLTPEQLAKQPPSKMPSSSESLVPEGEGMVAASSASMESPQSADSSSILHGFVARPGAKALADAIGVKSKRVGGAVGAEETSHPVLRGLISWKHFGGLSLGRKLLVVGLIGLGAVIYELNCTPTARAIDDCEDRIRNVLKDPKTAEFSDWQQYNWKSNDKLSRIEVKVRATNSFGAFLTKTMSCHYNEQGQFESLDDF